mmetsp:Transcript_13334/g.43493  ORF Transcript_13334/g.43493 Transcript_13334/m.43493 type:complete len:266 (+) Transcript_13334:2057-2854(+)
MLLADFSFADAPLSSLWAPATGSAAYVATVLALSWYMRVVRGGAGVEGPLMRLLQAAHNLVLCLGSLAMLLGTLRELARRGASEAPAGPLGRASFLFCERPDAVAVGPLYAWSYLYYLSKYYELLDTVLQLLKGRPPPHFFLHVYHHAVVLFMAWSWCAYCQSLQWGGLLFNTAVHVLMYYYYFRTVLKLPTPWKRLVTQFQIVQFGFSLLCFLVTAALLATGSACAGTGALAFNLAFNVTLLLQFFGVLGKNDARSGGSKKRRE